MATDLEPGAADLAYWLYEYQKTMTNVRYQIAHGGSETALKVIDALIDRRLQACMKEPPT